MAMLFLIRLSGDEQHLRSRKEVKNHFFDHRSPKGGDFKSQHVYRDRNRSKSTNK